MITDEEIKQFKSYPQKEVMEKICDSISVMNDISCQVLRAHLWAEGFIDGILHQISKDHIKGGFAIKQKRLFELGLIDEARNQELKILNDIRNLYAHNLYPHEQALEAIKKFPTYEEIKMPPELESLGVGALEMGKFGLISLILLVYLLKVFWDPKVGND